MGAGKFHAGDVKSSLLRQRAVIAGVPLDIEPPDGVAIVDDLFRELGMKIDEERIVAFPRTSRYRGILDQPFTPWGKHAVSLLKYLPVNLGFHEHQRKERSHCSKAFVRELQIGGVHQDFEKTRRRFVQFSH